MIQFGVTMFVSSDKAETEGSRDREGHKIDVETAV